MATTLLTFYSALNLNNYTFSVSVVHVYTQILIALLGFIAKYIFVISRPTLGVSTSSTLYRVYTYIFVCTN